MTDNFIIAFELHQTLYYMAVYHKNYWIPLTRSTDLTVLGLYPWPRPKFSHIDLVLG